MAIYENLGLKGFRIVGHMKICRNPFVWQKIYKYLEWKSLIYAGKLHSIDIKNING